MLNNFVSGLEKEEQFLKQATVVAESFTMIENREMLENLQKTVKAEYQRVQNEKHQEGIVAYGILSGMFGEKAVIDADILVHTTVVYGEVSGNIRATNRIELHQPARVFGDLSSPMVIMDAGVVFHGNCSMEPKDDTNSKTINVVESQT